MAMRVGALMMMDALGFKGIWNRHPHDQVIAKLRSLRSVAMRASVTLVDAEQARRSVADAKTRARLSVSMLSDTCVIGASVEGAANEEFAKEFSVIMAAHAATALMARAAIGDAPAFAYRGFLTVGEFEMDDPFVIGEAVDAAAESMNSADGAFVWLSPSASALMDPYVDSPELCARSPWIVYPVPMKGRPPVTTKVINPLYWDSEAPRFDADAVRLGILNTFDVAQPEVERKRKHTQDFLDAALDFVRQR